MQQIPIFLGKRVTDGVADTWQESNIEVLANLIRNPEDSFKANITALRNLKNIDIRKYGLQKRNLPYFISARFQDNRRVIANFIEIYALVIDFDHLPISDLDPSTIRSALGKDKRVALAFISPGGDGVKVIIPFSKPIQDAELYAKLYKNFVSDFAKHHQILSNPDMVTHDVSRICFLSYDPDLVYNPEAEGIQTEQWVNLYPSVEDLFQDSTVEVPQQPSLPAPTQSQSGTPILSPSSQQLRALLYPEKKEIYSNPNPDIPELNMLVTVLQEKLGEYGMELSEVSNIQYGKKIRVRSGFKFGEVNVFWGKKGLSIVNSPKQGTDKEVMEALHNLIVEIVNF
jgi:hypothetical protein